MLVLVPRMTAGSKAANGNHGGTIASIIAICYILDMKVISYSREAKKSLSRMQPKRQAAIYAKLEAYARGEAVDIKRLKGSLFHRIRVGDDCVIIDDQGCVVMVISAGPRGGIYKE